MKRLGPFLLVRPLREGGMGALDVVYNVPHRRVSVLKRNRDPNQVTRFHDEMQLAPMLGEHPNLVGVLDVGEAKGTPYIELQFIGGLSLDDLAGRSRIPPPVAVAAAAQICAALVHTHSIPGLKFVHRDISVGNIMIEHNGNARLMDYGLSLSSVKRHMTAIGLAPGTPGFASPEQRFRMDIDGRSDIFSLGAVMWCLLVGRPFYGEQSADDAVIKAPRVRTRRDDIPVEIDNLVARALEALPDNRFQSAAEMRSALLALLPAGKSETDVLADFMRGRFPHGQAEWTREIERVDDEAVAYLARRRRLVMIGACGAASLALVGVGAWWSKIRRNPAPSLSSVSPSATAAIQQAAPSSSPVTPVTRRTPTPISDPPSTVAKVIPPPTLPRQPREEQIPAATLREWEDARRDIDEKRFANAERVFARLQADPRARPLAHLGLAELRFAQKRFGDAVRASTRAANDGTGETKVEAIMLRAEAEMRLGQCEAASGDFKRALKMNPANGDARAGIERAGSPGGCKAD